MNALEFWGRIFGGVFIAMLSLALFSTKNLMGGTATLITAIIIVLSPIAMSRRDQRPHPLSSLKQEFDIYMLLSWIRGMLGVFLGIAGLVTFDPGIENQDNSYAAAPVFLLLGWLLLSPLSNKVFTYPPPNRAVDGRWRWSTKAGGAFIIRTIGLFVTLVGAVLLTIKEVKLAEALLCIAWGVAFTFITPIKQFFKGAAQSPDVPASEITEQSAIVSPEIQINQPATIVTPTSQAVNAIEIELPGLAELYKNLQWLPAANKGTAYAAFLNRLFNTEGLLTAGAFTVKDTLINGSFELDGMIYILAAKWQTEKSDENALLIFNAK